ncbi:MAG: zinc ribbon domain-containing protein [Rhodoferax sp.]|nr:zinc ribbon domain-containing protein [Rhodoferax sp.]
MPIYAYKCEACGFVKDVLQKMSDAPLQDCPTCGKPNFKKQVTAAGFQLKGSGWYATDFKGGASPATTAQATGSAESAPAPATADAVPAKTEATSVTPAAPAAG